MPVGEFPASLHKGFLRNNLGKQETRSVAHAASEEPPFFDPEAGDTFNYGATGSMIGQKSESHV